MECKWGKLRNGAPALFARKPNTKNFYFIDNDMFEAMKKEGVMSAFERFTLLGDIFSVPV